MTSNPNSIEYEDFEVLIKSPHIENEELTQILEKEVGIVVDPEMGRDEILEEVWAKFQDALKTYEEEKKKHKVNENLVKRKKSSSKSSPNGKSRKEFIIDLIKVGEHTKEDILQIVSDEYNYTQQGKTPNTRVSKVIKEMRDKGYLQVSADGVLSLKP